MNVVRQPRDTLPWRPFRRWSLSSVKDKDGFIGLRAMDALHLGSNYPAIFNIAG